MTMVKARLGLSEMTPSDKSKELRAIAASIDGKPEYAGLALNAAALRELADKLDDAQAAVPAAKVIVKRAIENAHSVEDEVDSALRAQAASAEKAAAGNPAFLIGAGFNQQASGAAAATFVPVQPTGLVVVPGDVLGSLRCLWHGRTAPVYVWQAREVGSTAAPLTGMIHRSRVTISNLKSGVEYEISVAGVRDGQGPWSDPIVRRVP